MKWCEFHMGTFSCQILSSNKDLGCFFSKLFWIETHDDNKIAVVSNQQWRVVWYWVVREVGFALCFHLTNGWNVGNFIKNSFRVPRDFVESWTKPKKLQQFHFSVCLFPFLLSLFLFFWSFLSMTQWNEMLYEMFYWNVGNENSSSSLHFSSDMQTRTTLPNTSDPSSIDNPTIKISLFQQEKSKPKSAAFSITIILILISSCFMIPVIDLFFVSFIFFQKYCCFTFHWISCCKQFL